jgi:hypothetical protein
MLLAALLTVVVIWLAGVAGVSAVGGSSTRHPTEPAVHRALTPAGSALVLLRDWDRRRAAAWASGDPIALARLYVPGSRTGVRDRLDLRRWADRGLRVTGLRQQVRSVRVIARTRQRLVVVVTDRTVGGVAVAATRRTALPTSGWETHRITLRRSGPGWRVVEVRGQPAR